MKRGKIDRREAKKMQDGCTEGPEGVGRKRKETGELVRKGESHLKGAGVGGASTRGDG